MEHINEGMEQLENQLLNENEVQAVGSYSDNLETMLFPQCGTTGNCSCGGRGVASNSNSEKTKEPSYIYACGKIELRFPNQSVEKELAQVIGRAETVGLTDYQALHSVLSKRENRYLARQLRGFSRSRA
ncbi:hypothetical protein J2S10_001822 [Neobacillus ginsengisoli]|uniref:PatG domain-containing protein n=1 Tax=Neobacillus ginsengisoli TaxID=904295 RepID=A0ABT9XSZ7_9BACI|nr:hypothetical protein [Neobacillus ginsengisoli]MDQ0198681.1 hypothetical protein [Neobacillus ginsengisoli]